MKFHVVLIATLLAGAVSPAFSAPIMATVVQRKGSIAAAGANGHSLSTEIGKNLPEHTAVNVSAGGELGFIPFPSGFVLLGSQSGTSSAIEQLQLIRSGDRVQSRQATIRLDSGRLLFGVEQFDPQITSLEVATPHGTASAAEATEKHGKNVAGVVEVLEDALKMTALGGACAFHGGEHGTIQLSAGSVLHKSSERLEVLNLLTGKVIAHGADGKVQHERAATADELQSGRETFQAAVGIVEQAISAGSLAASFTAAISGTVTEVNQALASAGIPAIDQTAVGATVSEPPRSASLFSGAPAPGGTSANPANVSGLVRSNER
jgi:hypothetical protein